MLHQFWGATSSQTMRLCKIMLKLHPHSHLVGLCCCHRTPQLLEPRSVRIEVFGESEVRKVQGNLKGRLG